MAANRVDIIMARLVKRAEAIEVLPRREARFYALPTKDDQLAGRAIMPKLS
jgi:hypothetical protein